ncbi:unnamed protein product, partial [Adineta ricciae]
PSCNDGNKNQNETDTDCGGVCGATCGVAKVCQINGDCANGNCHTGLKTCQDPSCFDGNKNQNETDLDCGGICGATCNLNQTCLSSLDCIIGNCHATLKICQPLSCSDGNKNQGEGDIDCGGPCTTLCNISQTCLANTDCVNGNCHQSNHTCQNPSCNDGNKNQGEIDVDCGGPCSTKCAINQVCITNSDCANNNCHMTKHQCLAPSCDDGNLNQNETDLDCGGICIATCALNQSCKTNADCANYNCPAAVKTCQPYSCFDGNKNQGEGDVDCGGPCSATLCSLYKACNVNSDCLNGNCHQTNHTCQPASCNDGNKNQNEVDIDCSGPCTKKCSINQGCVANSDCANSNCHTTKHQCLAPSCDDGNLNQNETDLDCGGVCVGTCAFNRTCKINADCTNYNCPTALLRCALYSCFDGNKNQGEGDVDCGGPCNTTLCALNKTCNVNSDCANGNCNQYNHTCRPVSCSDGNKNQNETDVDCGGVCGAKCKVNQTCSVNTDCANGNCHHTNLTCQNPSCNDGNKNQGEIDVDCSGPCSTRCIVGQNCNSNGDCANGNCNAYSYNMEIEFTTMPSLPNCNDGNKNQDETDADCGGATCSGRCDNNRACLNSTDCGTDMRCSAKRSVCQ